MNRYVVVFVTVPSARVAKDLSTRLVKEKLAACASAVPGIRSWYWWQGKIDSSSERLLILKTQKTKLPLLIRRVKALHPYSVPEVIALPVIAGHPGYLRWIDDSLSRR